jgi:ATP-dependent RNA helicase RhlE
MKFTDYPISIELKLQLAELGFKKPTDIQFKSIKHILEGEDLFGIAQTGSGKTAAFVIPIIDVLSKLKGSKGPQCVVLAPTRELAEQITRVFNEIGSKTTVRAVCVMGGTEQESQIKALKNGVQVVVATPGRVFDLRNQGVFKFDNVRFLVIDEADRMLDLGFGHDVKAIHKFSFNKYRQTLFFSATIDKKVKALAYDLVRDAIRIQVSPENRVSKNVEHAYIRVEMDDKRFFLENMVKEYEDFRFLVFVRTKVRSERVVAAMERVGLKAEFLHGGMDQKSRFDVLERFRKHEIRLLITTDVSARGIDIPEVDMVINYDLPESPEQYVHRVGRTGRGTNTGQALYFCAKEEEKLLADIQGYLAEEVEELEVNKNDYKAILDDSEDLSYDWKKLLDEANESDGTVDNW